MDEKQTALSIKVVTLIIAAYLTSGIIVDLAGSSIPVLIKGTQSDLEPVAAAGKLAAVEYYSPVWEKNVFNPGGVTREERPSLEEVKVETEKVEEYAHIPVSALNYTLMGTVAGPETHSFAIIKIPAEKEQMLYKVGDTVGPARIVRIERNRVILNNGGRQEMIEVAFDAASMAAAKGGATSASGIKKVSANRYVLDRKEVDRLSGDMGQFMTQVRVVPNIVRGRASGYKLMNIKKGSLVEAVGLENGDIIKEINGKPIDKPEAAFGAYKQLKDEGRFVIEVERRGKRETLSYDIR